MLSAIMEYKTVWISDLHLGTRGCNARGLLDFLRHNEFRTLYLVGDVIDIWRLKKDRYWPQTQNDVVQKILRKARHGTKIVVIPGNHDEFCRNFLGVYGNVAIKTHDVYTTITGRRLLVMHGHEFDTVTTHARWLAYLGDAGYTLLLNANRPLNYLWQRLGLGYRSLSAYAKRHVKNAVSYISQFEEAVGHYAALHDADGIVCGHIHTPAIRHIRGITYYNCGDWVENSTALVERLDGTIRLLRWEETGLEIETESIPSMLDVHDQSDLLVAETEYSA
jgi:UDP-2,3-diacylglucosamine pyrophosphatase LpxH